MAFCAFTTCESAIEFSQKFPKNLNNLKIWRCLFYYTKYPISQQYGRGSEDHIYISEEDTNLADYKQKMPTSSQVLSMETFQT